MAGFLKTENKRHRIILKRWSWSFGLYCLFFFAGLYACYDGVLKVSVPHFLAVYSIIFFTQVLFYWMVKTGYYERWDEPTFVYYEIMVGMSALVYFMFWVDDVLRPTLVNITILGIIFGMFAVHRRHFIILAAYPVIAYAIAGAIDFWQGTYIIPLELFAFQLTIIILVMAFFTYISNKISKIRKNLNSDSVLLKQQTHRLESTYEELKKGLEDMSERAVKDGLTGLYNRRQFVETLNAQKIVAEMTGCPLGFLIIDIDHFKQVNDIHGHLAGDMILKSFKQLPARVLRKADFIARFGGEEFVVLLPNTDEKTMLDVAERVRAYIESITFDEIEPNYNITISIGSTFYHGNESLDEMMGRADKALYRAKEGGRNQVVYQA